MNEVARNNYEEMSNLEILANGQNGISIVLTRMENDNKKRDQRLSILEESDREKEKKINIIEEKMDYIASPENSIMYRELVGICRTRVNYILNTTNDGLYKNFWKPFFNMNIHSSLCSYFKVGSDRYIKTKDFETAKDLAYKYVPTDAYLKTKIDDLLLDMKNGVLNLSKDRLLSFKVYCNDSKNGILNLFD